jgi:tetratricopeptide (TPR) repeat protein
LDWIVMKALEKDRARRYASPVDLAADIARHLNDEPVAAQPPSTAYRARKFIRRHRLGVAAATVVTAALVAAVVGTSVGLVRARRAEATAQAERARSEKAATFLAGTLSGINSRDMGRTLGSTLRSRGVLEARAAAVPAKVAEPRADDVLLNGVNLIDVSRSLVDDEILGKAVARIEKDLEQEPALAAGLYEAVGNAYENLQLFQSAFSCFERGVQLSESGRGRDATATNNLKLLLAGSYAGLGRYREAQRVYLEAVDSLKRTRGVDARETLIAMASLGWNYQQEGQARAASSGSDGGPSRNDLLNQAETVFRETLTKMQRVLGADDLNTLSAAHGLGLTLMVQGRFLEAEPILRDAVTRKTRVQGEDHADTINTSISLGAVIYFSGRRELAEKMALELLERSRRVVGDDGFLVLLIEEKLGGLYLDQGRYDDAEPLLRDSASKAPRVLGEQSQFTKEAIASLARLENLRSHGHQAARKH